MKRFEYRIYVVKANLNHEQEKDLNNLGKDGWEMVSCGTQNEGYGHNIYFKREII